VNDNVDDPEVGVGEAEGGEHLYQTNDHAQKWGEALNKAIEDAERKGLIRPDGRDFDVRKVVTLKRRSPGWVDGYKIVLTPGP
jgi:hypothetical protein